MLRTTPRRITYLSGLAVVIGALAAGAAWVLIKLIGFLTNLLLFGRIAFNLPSMSTLRPSPWIVVVAVLGSLAVALIARWSPIIKGHGIPEAMESILKHQSRVAPRTAITKPLSASLAIGTGGPFGAEGPIIVTGGSIGSLVGQILRVSPSERKILLACGAAGGMAATFGAPIASIVLVTELLLFEFSTRAFIPTAIAASVAGAIHTSLFGAGPLFRVPNHEFAGLAELPLFIPLGLLCGLLAVVITKGLFLVEAAFRRLPIGEFWHPMIGALGFGLVGMAVPEVLGVGYDQIDAVLAGGMAAGTLAILAGAKMLAWWMALGSGTSGGTLAPVMLIAAAFGALVGDITLQIAPGTTLMPGAFALVAMAATFGAATRATLTSIIFVFEITQDYNAILPLILASVLADLVGTWLLPNTLMTEKLHRRGYRVSTDLQRGLIQATPVGDIMTTNVVSIKEGMTVHDAIGIIEATGHVTFPIIDEHNKLTGIISRDDLYNQSMSEPVDAFMRHEVVTITPGETVQDVNRLMIAEGIEHVPVVDAMGRVVGICTRTNILAGVRAATEAEERQDGWISHRRAAASFGHRE